MSDLIVGLGLVLVIEGLLWAGFPGAGRHMLEAASATPETTLRICGAVSILFGVLLVWFVRGA
jgi:uncharacterized protein